MTGPAAVAIAGAGIVAAGTLPDVRAAIGGRARETVHVGDRLITPGLVDAHTHPVFARDRADEFILRTQGADYEAIAKAGGGILNSAAALAEVGEDALVDRTRRVFDRFLAHGTTTIEAKSGYGLSTEGELKSLRALAQLREGDSPHPLEAVPTFLGAHEVPAVYRAHESGRDAGREAYVQLVIDEMLPAVAAAGLAEYCDVFCERGVFTADEAERVLTAANALGIASRIHTDEFADVGGTGVAERVGAASADHLHVTTEAGIAALARGSVAAVLLPGTSFFLGSGHDAPARRFVEAGLSVVIATDYNPGSSHILSLPFCFTLAALSYGLTPEECLTAATVNAACSLGRGDRLGQLAPGYDADLVVWDAPNVAALAYAVADNRVHAVYKRGNRVVPSSEPA